MNIRDLTYLRAVARHGHFGRAATACNVSQPTLSMQLKKLESTLGVTLIERAPKSVKLTPVGVRVLALANEALGAVAGIQSIAREARDPLSGAFRLGSIPTISPFLIPRVLGRLESSYPKLELGFREAITQELTRDLLDGHLDAAILATPPETSRLTALPLFEEPLLVIHPTGHDLSELERMEVKDLPLEQIILLSEGHCFRDQTVDLCSLRGAAGQAQTTVSSLETTISLVAAGQGVAIVPYLAQVTGRLNRPGITVRSLRSWNAHRQINLTFRSSAPQRALFEAIAEDMRGVMPDID